MISLNADWYTSTGESDYGPIVSVSVLVLDNDPAKSEPGRTTEMVGVTVYVPAPVPLAVLKNSTDVGAVEAAGTPTDVMIAFDRVASEQVPLTVQVAVVPVMVEALLGNVPAEPVSGVEVMVTFHPPAAPVKSLMLKGIVYVIVVPGVPEKV